jgi:hypothetical protein
MGRHKAVSIAAPSAPRGGGKTYFVFSTMANDQLYTLWKRVGPAPTDMGQNAAPPTKISEVLIAGDYGMAIAPDNHALYTSRGRRTEISEEQLGILEQISQFRDHRERGYLTVEDTKWDVERVVADMSRDDRSMPITPSDYENAGPDGVRPIDGAVRRAVRDDQTVA